MSIEALKNVKAIVVDKTGTITKGNLVVAEDHSRRPERSSPPHLRSRSTDPDRSDGGSCKALRDCTEGRPVIGKGIKAILRAKLFCRQWQTDGSVHIDYGSGEETEIFLALSYRVL